MPDSVQEEVTEKQSKPNVLTPKNHSEINPGSQEWPRLAPKFSLIASLALAVVVFFVFDLALGSVKIPIGDVITILWHNEHENIAWQKIIEYIRLPKGFTAILAGAALSVGGLQMQTLFRNPLAGPSVLGITAGASLGVAIVMLASGAATNAFAIKQLGISGSWLIVLASTMGSALVLLIILGISMQIKDNIVLLIVGIMVGNVTISLISVWQYFSSPEEIQDYLIWTFGSLGGVIEDQLVLLSVVVISGLFVSMIASKSLNVMLLGENYARSMGLSTSYLRITVILATSLLAGSVTGFCGPIGFIGIAVPHLTRSLLNTSDHRFLIPSSALMGALLMLICDIIAQLPGSQTTLPINAVTALVGSPIVIWVIMKNRNLKASFS